VQPFFYFVFPEQVLRHAPHTIFTALHVEPGRIAQLQNTLVEHFPNITVIDVTPTLAAFTRLIRKLSFIIRFFTGLSILAGVCILISALLATRAARIREAVYFTILGATRGFVRQVFGLESLLLGLASALLAVVLAHLTTWLVCRYFLDIAYQPFVGVSLLLVLSAVLLITGVGRLASQSILQHKPARFLREHTEG
jgi:putative ABC transport system permease protein